MSQETPTTSTGRHHVGYIPTDAPIGFAESLALPYELPRTEADCRKRFGKPGRRVLITVQAQEFQQ